MITDKPRIPLRQMLTVGLLPGPLKKAYYRLRGYRIGRGVRLAWGSVVCGREVVIGDYTQIGLFSIVRGSRITLGCHVKIGSMTFLDTPVLEIGDESRINEQVFIGGLQEPQSRFVLGKRCQIFQLTYINPAKWITVGDDSAIGGHTLVFGHSSWLSELDGYPVTFAPIEIGRNVSISWRVFILPGVTIGDGTVVGANSLVNKSLPARCLATGSPARIVSRAPYFPRPVSWEERERILRRLVREFLDYLLQAGVRCREDGALLEITRGASWFRAARTWNMRLEYAVKPSGSSMPPTDVYLSLRTIAPEIRRSVEKWGGVWIDLEARERADGGDSFTEEVVMFLRRHGVRLARVPAFGSMRCG